MLLKTNLHISTNIHILEILQFKRICVGPLHFYFECRAHRPRPVIDLEVKYFSQRYVSLKYVDEMFCVFPNYGYTFESFL